jgi:sterol desaturase/sphingolipid hydroxylase (fatty acid hydroxylase superfamily)
MRATKVSAHSESKRMFESDLFEFFSRIPPWQPPAVYLPVIGYLSWVGFAELHLGVLTFTAVMLVGIVAWSLMEYWLHRLVFHYQAKTKLGKRMFWLLHGVHHDWPHDKMRLVFPPAVSIPLAFLFWWMLTEIFGEALRYPAMVGLSIGYLAYDMIHYYVHHFSPKNRVGKFLRRYHLAHHFKDPEHGFGVSNPLWDYVFGTVPNDQKS